MTSGNSKSIFHFRTLISIVNYCTAEHVCNLLPGLVEQIDINRDRIIIVDNMSPDDSLAKLKSFVSESQYDQYVSVVLAEKNGGFSYGNNLAIKKARDNFGSQPEYIWLLNPDTNLMDDAFKNLLSFAEKNPKAGIIGSRLEDEGGGTHGSAFRFHSLKSELMSGLRLGLIDKIFSKYLVSPQNIPQQSVMVDWLAGASMFVRYKVFEDAGMMDETYFLYFEETDFCLQAKRAGWECWYVPESRVVHYVGQSTGVVSGDVQRRRRPKYWFQSRQHYFIKNHGIVYTMLADLAWGLGFSLLTLRYLMQGKKGTDPEYMLRDFWRNSIFLSWLDRF